MRKSLWMLPMVLLITALGSTPAHADGVDVLNGAGQVTAIDGITLNGSLYNVTFTGTIDNTFSAYAYNSPTIISIENAINTDLGATHIIDSAGNFYGLAAAAGITADSDNLFQPPWTIDFGYTTSVYTGSVALFPTQFFWANFNPAVVATPEPATAPLTLAGLGVIAVLMWKRRQDALRQPQAT